MKSELKALRERVEALESALAKIARMKIVEFNHNRYVIAQAVVIARLALPAKDSGENE